jgi:hypothetical protein
MTVPDDRPLSDEAAVAAEAAATAVETLHEREAVDAAAQNAELTATMAEDTAAAAEQRAAEAETVAQIAEQTAQQAAAEAQQVREEAGEAVASALTREEFEAFRSEMSPIRDYFARLEAERIAAENEPQVEEVSVEDGIGAASRGNASGPAAGNGTGNSGPDGTERTVTVRHGLRHRIR